jgi:TIR domain
MAQEEQDRLWEEGQFRLFLSHVSDRTSLARELKIEVAKRAIDGFVAHADIEPTRQWEDEIRTALATCHALVLLLSDGVHESDWVDQETGWALARDLLIIPVNVGLIPYGFVGRYQALPGTGDQWERVPTRIVDLLLRNPRTGAQLVESFVRQFEATDSFDEARWNFDLLRGVQAFTADQLYRIEHAYENNSQLTNAYYVQDWIQEFLRGHWAAYEEPKEWSEDSPAPYETGSGTRRPD